MKRYFYITMSVLALFFAASNLYGVTRIYDRVTGGLVDADKDDAEWDNTNNEINTHEADTSAHDATGGVVGVTKSQSLTNKTIVSPTITGTGTATFATLATTTSGTITTYGGNIDGTTIGNTTPAAGTFTTGTITTSNIDGGAIDGTTIGGSTPAAGAFTTLGASGISTLQDDVKLTATKKLYLDGGTDTYITESAANTIKAYAGTTDQLEITGTYVSVNNGNLLIPTTKKINLDGDSSGDTWISSNSSANEIYFYAGNTSYMIVSKTGAGMYFPNHATTSSSANAYVSSADGQFMRSTSSRKYKENIADLEIDTSKVYLLRPVSYDDKQTHKGRYIGLIAEEVDPIITELVEHNAEGLPESVNYDRLPVLLLAELKKMKARVDDLESRIKILEAK